MNTNIKENAFLKYLKVHCVQYTLQTEPVRKNLFLPTTSTAAALHITIHLQLIQSSSCHAKSLWDRSLKTVVVEIGFPEGSPVANAFWQCSSELIVWDIKIFQ